jgi:hypothetical protein
MGEALLHSDWAEIIAQCLGEDADLRAGSEREFSSSRGCCPASRDCNGLSLDLEVYRKLFHVLKLSLLGSLARSAHCVIVFAHARGAGGSASRTVIRFPSRLVTRKSRIPLPKRRLSRRTSHP